MEKNIFVNMPGPPLVPDDDPPNENDDDPPEEPMEPPTYPPGFPPYDTHPPDPHSGLPPPDDPTRPSPPGPPPSGSPVPPTQPPHQPLPHFSPPTSLPLQPLPGNAFIPSLVVPPNISDTQMHHSIKRETTVPASSPQKKAKAPAPGNQMIAPSGSSSRNHLGGDVPVTTSQKVTMTLMKMMRLTHKQDLGQERPFYRLIMMQKNNQLMFQFLMMTKVIR